MFGDYRQGFVTDFNFFGFGYFAKMFDEVLVADGSKAKVGDDIKKFKRYRMSLDTNWNWQKKKLGCRIRPENGNPAKDALREVFAELGGVDLNKILEDMRKGKKEKEAAEKKSETKTTKKRTPVKKTAKKKE